jgi:tRNA pseudouridine13 synthase
VTPLALEPSLDSAIHRLEFAWGGPPVSARLRASAEDFLVHEIPLVEPAGQGEHVWLLIRKRLENTEQVAGTLARLAGVPPRDVGFAGLKDRHAVTEQWFSVHTPGGKAPDWTALNGDSITLLRHARHNRKLRRGVLRGNAFRIRIRDITGDIPALGRRLASVAAGGVPNYFGEQRFGRGGSNLLTAGRLFSHTAGRLSRLQRGLALSAARSYLFNQVLARRVASRSWDRPLPGEVLQLDGSHSYFIASEVDETLRRRVCEGDVHPTGPLYGRGGNPATGEALQLESDCLAPFDAWCEGLVEADLRQERRSLRLLVGEPAWTWPQPDCLELSFSLPAGAYATSVLRELVRHKDG